MLIIDNILVESGISGTTGTFEYLYGNASGLTGVPMADLSGYLPLSGSTTTNPITGNLIFETSTTGLEPVWQISREYDDGVDNTQTYISFDTGFSMELGRTDANDNTKNISFRFTSLGLLVSGGDAFKGIEYSSNYASNYSNRSLVDKQYVDDEIFNAIDAIEIPDVSIYLPLSGGTMTGTIFFGDSNKGIGYVSNTLNIFGLNSNFSLDDDGGATWASLNELPIRYDTNIVISNNRDLVDKQYVDTAISANTPDLSGYAQLSGATFTGSIAAPIILSGTTDLTDIFLQKGGYLLQKSGIIDATGFTGNPRKATVTFATPFPNNLWSPTVIGGNNRTWSIESKTASGFTINSNANTNLTLEVYWTATGVGEGFK